MSSYKKNSSNRSSSSNVPTLKRLKLLERWNGEKMPAKWVPKFVKPTASKRPRQKECPAWPPSGLYAGASSECMEDDKDVD